MGRKFRVKWVLINLETQISNMIIPYDHNLTSRRSRLNIQELFILSNAFSIILNIFSTQILRHFAKERHLAKQRLPRNHCPFFYVCARILDVLDWSYNKGERNTFFFAYFNTNFYNFAAQLGPISS